MPLTKFKPEPALTAVTYKFKVPALADYFEGLSGEQCHVALEGALNIIFAVPAPDQSGLALEGDVPQNEDEDLIDHEQRIVNDVTFALYAHQLGNEIGLIGTVDVVEDDYENTPLYSNFESMFRTIVNKLADEINEDRFNQDVVTLYEEMQFYHRIELYNHYYSTESEILTVTVMCTL